MSKKVSFCGVVAVFLLFILVAIMTILPQILNTDSVPNNQSILTIQVSEERTGRT